MSRQELNQVIVNYLSKYQATKIGVFGSYARGEETSSSDLDLLVSFQKPFGLLQLVRMERELSEMIGTKVDMVTERALKNEKLKKYIQQDLQIIYG
jgi:uncharacterized protein